MAAEAEILMAILGICAVCLDYFMGIVLLRKIVKISEKAKQKYYTGVVGFYIAHGTYVLTYLVYRAMNLGILFNFGVMLVLSSLVLLVFSIESSVFTRSRFFFTIFGIIAVSIIAIDVFYQLFTSNMIKIYGIRLMEWPQYFANPLLATFVFLVYLYAFIKAAGAIKKNALLMMTGIIAFMIAELAISNIATKLLPLVQYLGPPLRVVAIVLLSYALLHLSVWKERDRQSPEA
ncbi:MAG: hypothetical protein Q6373_015745 [Candidatus Sigynarchaeota archaeon]